MKYLPILIKDELTGATAFDFADGLSLRGFDEFAGIVLQLDETSVIDVNGMAVIVRIYSHLQGLNKRLYVQGASEEIGRGLERLGLSRVLGSPPVARTETDTDPTLAALTGSHKTVTSG